MKKLLFALLLMLGAPVAWAQNSGGINGIPNVSVQTPVTIGDCTKWVGDTEVADSGGPCGGTGAPGGSSYSIQYNNAGSFGGFLPAAIGTYCIQWTSLTAAPVPATCPSGTYPGAGIVVSTGSAWGTSITPGTGVETALGVNVGSAGAFVVNGGALGTPSSGVGTNITGVNAASVGGFTLPCTVPTLVSGDYLTNNGTTCSWATVTGSGTVNSGTSGQLAYYAATGTAVSGATVGAGLTLSSGTLSTTQALNAQTGTTYTIATTDAGKVITFNNAAAVAVTLPAATTTGFGPGFAFTVQNTGVGTVTITPTTSTINGAASLTIPTNYGCSVLSDGTNYQVGACGALQAQVDALASGSTVTPSCAYKVNTVTITADATINTPTGCTPYTGQKLILIVQSASAYTYTATGYLTGATTGVWPASSTGSSKDDHFVLIYDGYLGTPGWALDGYNLGL